MSLNSSRKGWIGVGKETTFGVPAAMTDNIYWLTNTLEGVNKPIENNASYAQRQKTLNAVIGQQWGQGDVEFNLDVSQSGYFYAAAMGTTNNTLVSGSTRSHNHVLNQSNTPYSLSLYSDRVTDRQLFPGSTVDTMETKVSNGLATGKAAIKSVFPVTSVSGTETTASGTIFTWANYTFQFGATYALAQAAATTPLTDIDFIIKNNTEAVFESGTNSTTRIGQKDFEVTGSFTQYFEGTTERNNFYNVTPRAFIVQFLGTGTGTTQEKLQFNFYNSFIDTFSVNTGIDAFFVEKSTFVGDYSIADSKTMDIVQVNNNNNY